MLGRSDLASPPRWLRAAGVVAFVIVAANLFWHGSKPYAVGIVPAPWDKGLHVVLYAGFASSAWVGMGGTRWIADGGAVIAAMLVGVADELVQSYLPGRVVGLDDLLADLTGVVLAVVALALHRERHRVSKRSPVR